MNAKSHYCIVQKTTYDCIARIKSQLYTPKSTVRDCQCQAFNYDIRYMRPFEMTSEFVFSFFLAFSKSILKIRMV